MLANDKTLDRFRVEFRESLTPPEIDVLVSNPNLRVLQCASPVQSHTWDLLNQNLFPLRPDVEMRVYGFYSSTCDLSFVRRLSNVRRFSADCLMRATGVEHLSALVQLEELSIDIFNLETFDFLEAIPDGIRALFLGATKSRKPSLDSVGRFRSLQKLYIEGQQNGIDVIGDLQELEDVTLRSISTRDIEYVAKLPRLWSLDIKLGGIESLSAISGKESLKYLELWQIRGLSDISVVSSLSGLQYLFLQSLRNVTGLPDLSKLTKLRRLYLENMKGLRNVDAIQGAPALEEFIHVSAQNIRPEQYRGLLNMTHLREIVVGFGSQRKTKDFEDATIKSGKMKFGNTQFVFQ
jgi:hypothetical protein